MSATPLGGTAGKGSLTQALVSPKHLTSIATVHTWPFSAIAELIDNACDPDVLARDLWIDYEKIAGKPCLVFRDNGNGMDLNHLVKMLSLGFCEKDKYVDDPSTHAPIGHYGTGFKSGSMRLAKDALVFTVGKNTGTACIGFLSQTLCQEHDSETLVIPLMEYKRPQLQRSKNVLDTDKALDAILEFSPYNSEKKLKTELKNIMASESEHGTKIVLFNLKKNKGMLELDFESDPKDIRNPETIDYTPKSKQPLSKIAEHRQSLRMYCSMLFKVPKMKIHIRKLTVEHVLISGRLMGKETVGYKPKGKDKGTSITFGRPKRASKKQLDDYGFMLYYRNRLIQPYVKIGSQSKASCVGVIAVVDVDDILKPTHDKQRFLETTEYKSAMASFTEKLYDYCDGTSQSVNEEDESTIWDWAQCDRCRKWRRLLSIDESIRREKWYCQMNTDQSRNRCEIEEENPDNEYDVGGVVKKGDRKRRPRKSGKQGQTPQTDTSKGMYEEGRSWESQALPTTPSPSDTGHHTQPQPTTPRSSDSVRRILLQPTTSTPSGTGQHTRPHDPMTSPPPTGDHLARKPLSKKRKQPTAQSEGAKKRVRSSQSDTNFAIKLEPGTAGPSDTNFAIKLEPGTAGPPRKNSPAVSVSSNKPRPGQSSTSSLNQRISNLTRKITTMVKTVTFQVKQEDNDDDLEVPSGPSPESTSGTSTERSGELGGRSQPPCCARLRQDLHTLLAYMVQKRMVNVQQIGHVDQVEDTLHSVLRSLGLYSE